MGDPVVELRSVRRSFKGVLALDELSFAAPAGTITVLLGPNGAGKTTAVRMITGALPAEQHGHGAGGRGEREVVERELTPEGPPDGVQIDDGGISHRLGYRQPGPALDGYRRAVQVLANGRTVDLPDGATVATLIDRMGLTGRVVVVERNGEPVDRRSVASTALADGDSCEVVRAVAGG